MADGTAGTDMDNLYDAGDEPDATGNGNGNGSSLYDNHTGDAAEDGNQLYDNNTTGDAGGGGDQLYDNNTGGDYSRTPRTAGGHDDDGNQDGSDLRPAPDTRTRTDAIGQPAGVVFNPLYATTGPLGEPVPARHHGYLSVDAAEE